MNRRLFLAGAGAAAATVGAGALFWPDHGLVNPCRSGLPAPLAGHELVRAAWEGIDPSRVWDCHVHPVGNGRSDSGLWINPRMESLFHPGEYVRRLFFLNAGCVHRAPPEDVDARYLARMLDLMADFPRGTKLLLLAFDYAHDEAGRRDREHSAFHTPDAYAQELARAHPDVFEWAASIHPCRADAVERLERAAAAGARAVKWLPQAMRIDPASPRCERFYETAARLGIALLTHAGEEKAVHGAEARGFGNPLRLRRALDAGVRVVVAHCASVGSDVDLDAGPNGPARSSFELFARLMDEPRYHGLLYGDVSAVTQVNRSATVLQRLIERTDWHARLLNGSDYPLPGVMPLVSVRRLIDRGLLEAAAAPVLKAIRGYNPLLFDFVLKRNLRAGGKAFAPSVFHTRDFFLPRRTGGAASRN